ncbi:MAG TPA: hypothetical protein VFS05_06015 [Gemmatimonadaceae bacterium]|nr:hypothetical protein [Gemmatimonadaceae bacterium]
MHDVVAFLVGLAGVATILIGSYAAIKATNRIWGRGGGRPPLPPGDLTALAGRLERMEHAIDAMALEVERISEGQRFTTKLLAERAPAARMESRS